MDIVVTVLRQIVVDDMLDVGNVETTSRNRRADDNGRYSFLEVTQGFLTLLLKPVTNNVRKQRSIETTRRGLTINTSQTITIVHAREGFDAITCKPNTVDQIKGSALGGNQETYPWMLVVGNPCWQRKDAKKSALRFVSTNTIVRSWPEKTQKRMSPYRYKDCPSITSVSVCYMVVWLLQGARNRGIRRICFGPTFYAFRDSKWQETIAFNRKISCSQQARVYKVTGSVSLIVTKHKHVFCLWCGISSATSKQLSWFYPSLVSQLDISAPPKKYSTHLFCSTYLQGYLAFLGLTPGQASAWCLKKYHQQYQQSRKGDLSRSPGRALEPVAGKWLRT